MHLYNLWLPEPVLVETARERESFAKVVKSTIEIWRPDDPDSVDSTLKFIPIIDIFLKVRSDISLEDVDTLLVFGFEVFHASQNNLYAQVRWGFILTKLLKKFGKKLPVKVQWRPFYECLVKTHFKRNTGPEGWRLRQLHFQTITYLVKNCRMFFPSGSANEIWDEFRSALENPWHNSCLESSGFVKLFLPMNPENEDFFTSDWIKHCIDIWESIPNCPFWNIQWTSILERCIKNYILFDWECFLPALFTKYLNMFEV
ncbi:hypothetical protein ZOSMA_266G00020 [Zostera marina]|uniref:Proteasome activator Blm10 mid region domain-containing protein n=1 Tax=Zostera marina TaxID=29655 RepID=A0A0K9PEU0_ZOSMR|nr:hypothetical protein ZOSMA_266G00020 [Zostera marina]